MRELREKLKANANVELNQMIEKGAEAMVEITNPGESAVSPNDLARLVVGGRTGSLRKAVVSKMTRAIEAELLKRYTER